MKVIIGTHFYGEDFVDKLRAEFPDVQFAGAYERDDQIRESRDADVYFGWPDAETFAGARKLRWIACPGTGVDEIVSVPGIRDSPVVVTNAPGDHVVPMAEWTIGVMLALAHRLPQAKSEQDSRHWNHWGYAGLVYELAGAKIGLFGFGAIGRAVAQRALGLGMTVDAVSRSPNPKDLPAYVNYSSGAGALDHLCARADWLVVTAPYTAETSHAINGRRIALMKHGAHIVVVSRGGIVDEDALSNAIERGVVAGAALDTTETEPLPKTSPLWALKNVIITPHVSAHSKQMYEGRRNTFRENLRQWVMGKPLLHICDKNTGY